mmetsp:Transcript_16779/g.54870  ORF Transcript_16779/g.54870 Transcript_16779/m.54870 type:complete len:955 (-) Transcript_16779:69-2933(-)
MAGLLAGLNNTLGAVVFGNGTEVDDSGVEVLLERVANGVLADDRRTALGELRDLLAESKPAQGAFGTVGFPILLSLVQDEREDVELLRGSLEGLLAALTPHGSNPAVSADPALVNAELFSREPQAVALLLNLLEEEDFYVRYHTCQVLTALLTEHAHRLQEVILSNPFGVGRLMDMLEEREVIRNESLLLLAALTRGNEAIQKIVAFEGAFERLLNIVREEGAAEGGIIVQDSLELLNNLLRNNVSNQVFFRESSLLPKVPGLLKLKERGNPAEAPLAQQKAANLLCAMEMVMLLLATRGDDANERNRIANQQMLCKNGLMEALLPLALEGAARSAPVRAAALRCLGEMAAQAKAGQDFLASAFAKPPPSSSASSAANGAGPVPALQAVLQVALHAADAAERTAADGLFQSYCSNNPDGQSLLLSTIVPVGGEVDDADAPLTFGGILARALVGSASTSASDLQASCRAASVLQHLLHGNTAGKERLLTIPLSLPINASDKPELLLPKIVRFVSAAGAASGSLAGGSAAWLQAAFVRLLVVWLHECPPATAAFLASAGHLPAACDLAKSPNVHVSGMAALLLGMLLLHNKTSGATDANTILDVLSTRIGLPEYLRRIEEMQQNEAFRAAAAAPRVMSITRQNAAEATSDAGAAQRASPAASTGGVALYDCDFAAFVKATEAEVKQTVLALYTKPKPVVVSDASVWEVGEGETEGAHQQRLQALLHSQDVELAELRARNASLASQLLSTGSEVADASSSGSAAGAAASDVWEKECRALQTSIVSARAEAQTAVAAAQADADEARGAASKLEEQLQGLSAAYNSLEAEAFKHEEENRLLKAQISSGEGGPPAPSPDPALSAEALEAARAEARAEALAELEAAVSRARAEGAEEGKAEAEAAGESELNDLLVCLGQEESKTEKLRSVLEELGHDVDALLEGVGEDEEEEGEEEEETGE